MLTPWFPADVIPVREGVYEVKQPDGPWFRRFDGHQWYCGATDPCLAAMRQTELPAGWPPRRWRGLTAEGKQ